ncbi:hypothetical protein PILCRDRAFT_822332 [Piloderma croceum F 1598]|uniref:Uncharacterized protein n=1 Tax=Piloderma croceum (strain F 1598) TaxID=765440 RepID=A0A0C3FLP0_PILCF|nr:hypothetical protein PILCRDRAFT_822332 [Piloderma croceum F 1598]
MNIVQQCLSLAPVPYLALAFSALRFICSSVEQAQASKWQLKALPEPLHNFCRPSIRNTELEAAAGHDIGASCRSNQVQTIYDARAVDFHLYHHHTGCWMRYLHSSKKKHRAHF